MLLQIFKKHNTLLRYIKVEKCWNISCSGLRRSMLGRCHTSSVNMFKVHITGFLCWEQVKWWWGLHELKLVRTAKNEKNDMYYMLTHDTINMLVYVIKLNHLKQYQPSIRINGSEKEPQHQSYLWKVLAFDKWHFKSVGKMKCSIYSI
jgi:hypothetical protein